ncbi:uncharacterized protein C4orf54 homolog [Antennarius striatus]|uniref:uncharacterized protein C4orf54 homolog n=1 Tax=Antennarius striatus TaxID=241820 RepID=UPI0035B19BD4
MEAAEETLTYRDVTGLHRKLLPEDKTKDTDSQDHATEIKSDESNYVDLNMKPDVTKTVKVSFTGEGNQLSVGKCDNSKQREHEREEEPMSGDSAEEQSGDRRSSVPGPVSDERPLETLIELPSSDQDSDNDKQLQTELDCSEHFRSESDELQYTDMYLNSKTESDDGASAVLSDHCGSDAVEDESHYITTHEIQLTELDHDVDYDLGRGTCWDFEDNNLVYSFVDYASFESDDTQEGTLILEGRSRAKTQSKLGVAVPSTEQEDSDLCDSDKCASSDESVCENQSGDVNKGEIHLSIKTSSRAVNAPVNIFDNKTGDRSHFSVVSSGAMVAPLCDRAKYFIPAPGRQHLATKLRRKDINEYSSGASSSISELDDADKEVRNLTAKSFRSLACPYFDAINLSTSSESSMSDYGLHKWSSYWKDGSISRGRGRGVITHKSSSASLEMNKIVDSKIHGKSVTGMKTPQTKLYSLNKRTTHQSSSSSVNTDPKPSGITLNVRCNVEKHESARRPKCSKKPRANEDTRTLLARSGCEMRYHRTDSTGGTHKRAVFASSLLKNVISKKMQFEQERKMERGEICDTYQAISPCFQLKDQDGIKDRSQGRGFQRQHSETSSGFSMNSVDDQHLEGSRPNSCDPKEEYKSYKTPDDSVELEHSPLKAPPSPDQNAAVDSMKEDEPQSVKEAESISGSDPQTTDRKGLDTSSMLTKLLFVPSWQLFSKQKEYSEDLLSCPGPQKCEKEFKTDNNGNILGKEVKEKTGKTPEIKICLRSVKENKGCTLNIASLLTPKISYNTVNTFRMAGNAKCQNYFASDKIPNFTVRDIRDTKCKFQTPIYNVRDVRKLVKSSYRFVSLDKSDSKSSSTADKLEETATKESIKHSLPSPIVIKCHSVKTNAKQQIAEESDKQAEIPLKTSQSENTPLHCVTSQMSNNLTKQVHPELSEPHVETKLTRQRQEKFAGDLSEKKNEPKIPKQAVLEKLKAAVRTMEQLYVYDRNEWKRKTQAPQPITDSHVLSLIAHEEQGAEEIDMMQTERFTKSSTDTTDASKAQEDKGALNFIHVPYNTDSFETQLQKDETSKNRNILHFGNKAHVSITSVGNHSSQSSVVQTSSTMKSSNTLVAPLSMKIETLKNSQVEQGKVNIIPTNPMVAPDSENYLSIPGQGCTNEIRILNREPASGEVSSKISQVKTLEQMSPLVTEYPVSNIYPNTGATAGSQTQQQVVYLSPSVSAISPAPSTGQTLTQTQRKMLLDPTTGHYYLVDTSTQATTKRLLDTETGQYVDVPVPHSPVAPVAPVTPVPLSLSPMALKPGAYTPTYMIYPGFIPSPTLPTHVVLPQSPCHSIEGGTEMVKTTRTPKPETNAMWGENTYYSATSEASHSPQKLPVNLGHVTARGGTTSSGRKPVISITTQQGPRIIAPPYFDGTTMSFVVEHR